jgi:hypothetical protein
LLLLIILGTVFYLWGCSSQSEISDNAPELAPTFLQTTTPFPTIRPFTPTSTVVSTHTEKTNDFLFSVENQEIDLSNFEVISTSNIDRLEIVAQWGIGNIFGVALSPDASSLAIGTNTGSYLFDRKSGKLIDFIDSPIVKERDSNECGFQRENIAFSPDGKYLAVGDIDIKVWHVESTELYTIINGPKNDSNWAVSKVLYSLDGKHIVASWEKRRYTGCAGGGLGSFTIHNISDSQILYSQEFSSYGPNYEFNTTESGVTYFYSDKNIGNHTGNHSFITVDTSA